MVEGLRALGWRVGVVELEGSFPGAGPEAVAAFEAHLDALPGGEPVVVDGLAGGAHPEVLRRAARHRPVVALVHHPLGDESGLDEAERRRLLQVEVDGLRAVSGVVVTSPFTAGRLAELGVDGERIRVVIPGTEAPPQTPQDGAGEDPPLLLSVGSVTPRKGHDVLVAALGGLLDRRWRCAIVGSLDRAPDFAGEVIARAVRAGLGDRVAFAGEADTAALEEWWRRAHLFVLPSWYEGYGMALTEALVRGLPVVSTRAGAIPDTVPAGAGRLVPPGDVEALRAVLARLLDDADERRTLAAGARAHAAGLPDWETQARAFQAALEELLHG
jgi:glycosyltransferase involved in cell wall biosynthesis